MKVTMSANDYKCMVLVSRDQYEGLKSANSDGGGNSVDSGIGGDVKDSNVNNIDVSQGGTLVINDKGQAENSQSECAKRTSTDRHTYNKVTEHTPSCAHTTVPIVLGPHTQQTQGAQLQPESPYQQQRQEGVRVRIPTATANSARKRSQTGNATSLGKKSSELLQDLVSKRVASLTGKPPVLPKRRRLAVSDGDLNRAVVHDLRDVSKEQQTPKPTRPNLQDRQRARYKAQTATIVPYQHPKNTENKEITQESKIDPSRVPLPSSPPPSLPIRHHQPHSVPLPEDDAFSDDDDDGDVYDARIEGTSARTRPILVARRPPAAIRNVKRTKSQMLSGPIDWTHYEPRNKIQNSKNAPVRAVGRIARQKRGKAMTEDE